MPTFWDSSLGALGKKMKSPLTICVALVLLAFTAAYGMRVFPDTTVPPSPTLPEAYQKAVSSLGKEAVDLYCLSASAMANTETSEPTEWHPPFLCDERAGP